MKNTKIVALVAAVALLVLGTAFASFAATYNWYQDDVDWRCADKNGEDYYDAWAKSGDGWYWLGEEGYMTREALVDDGNKYVDADGRMVTNTWKKVADDEGNEYWMYFQNNGKKLTAKGDTVKPVAVGDKKYIFDENGYMLTGWVNLEGKVDEDYPWQSGVYYCGDENDGAVTYGWKLLTCDTEPEEDYAEADYWFWFKTNGQKLAADKSRETKENAAFVQKGINGKTYAFDEYGRMKAEWVNVYATDTKDIDSYAWFQSAEIGAKFADGWFRVVPNGEVDPGNNEDEAAKWFYAKKGKLASGEIKTINGKKYGFNDAGEMVSGLCAAVVDDDFGFISWADGGLGIDNADDMNDFINSPLYALYYFSADEDTDGSMKTGLQTVKVDGDDYSFYFSTKSGTKGQGYTGYQGNKYYYGGIKVTADDSVADYEFFKWYPDGSKDGYVGRYATATTVAIVPGSDKEAQLINEDAIGLVDFDEYALISKTGVVAKSGTKKDNAKYKYTFTKKADKEYYPDGAWLVIPE